MKKTGIVCRWIWDAYHSLGARLAVLDELLGRPNRSQEARNEDRAALGVHDGGADLASRMLLGELLGPGDDFLEEVNVLERVVLEEKEQADESIC